MMFGDPHTEMLEVWPGMNRVYFSAFNVENVATAFLSIEDAEKLRDELDDIIHTAAGRAR